MLDISATKHDSDKGGIVSVIMPCYNAEKYLPEAIDSVFNQSYNNVELIVVDDGSSDSSLSILQNYANRIILIEQENQGPDYARNRGIAASNGDFIAFLDADDYWAPDFIAKLLQSLLKENADIAYCGWQNIGLPEPRNKPYIPKKFERMDKAREFLRAAAPESSPRCEARCGGSPPRPEAGTQGLGRPPDAARGSCAPDPPGSAHPDRRWCESGGGSDPPAHPRNR